MPPPLILRIIGDATSYFKTADATIATNTKLAESFGGVAKASKLSADAEIAAATKAISAQRARVDALTSANAKLTAGSDAAAAGNVALIDAQSKLNRQLGVTTLGTRSMGTASKEAERDLGKFTRGALAGTGVASSLGRSLAFASTGFIAIAGGATLLTSSIKAALSLAATQRQVDAQLKTSGKTWDTYGARVDATDLKLSHVSGFTNQELLQSFGYLIRVTGNVSTSLRLNAVAADVARGRHIALSSASLALAKALGGSNTALRRLGIIIPTNLKGMEALNYVSAKFAGQAQAGATVADRFHASLVNTEEIIGTALLPTFDRLTTRLGNWLAKMNESGRLQRDVNEAVKIGGDVFHTLSAVIGIADRVTGSFKNTLEALIALKFASIIAGWIGDLQKLSLGWQAVAGSAGRAATAESSALGAGGAAAGGIAGAGVVGAGAVAGAARGRAVLTSREAAATNNAINRSLGRNVETSVATGLEAGIAGGAAVAATKLGGLKNTLAGLASKPIAILVALTFIPPSGPGKSFLDKLGLGFLGKLPLLGPLDSQVANLTKRLLDLNNKLPVSPFPGLGTNLPGPATPDTRFKLGTVSLVAGTSEAFQTLLKAGAQLPLIGTVTAKQELAAAKLLNTAAQHSQQVAKRIADSIVLLDHARAQIDLLNQNAARFTQGERRFGGNVVPPALQAPGFQPARPNIPQLPVTTHTGAIDFGVKPITIWASYQLTIAEQLAQVQAALTKTTQDDVAVAKGIIARIKAEIDKGHLAGNSLIQALQDEASAQGVIDSARQAAAQKAAQIAAAAKAAASSYTTPIDIQLAQARAQLTITSRDDIAAAKAALADAKAAVASGRKNKQGQLAAIQAEIQAQQTLDSLRSQSATTFTQPLRLQLALAKAQATGADQTPILEKMKAALERALKAAKGNIQKQIDIWNQITAVNSQLGSTVGSALGGFKQASTRALTAGLGLTAAQRAAERARLSQLGPGRTVPGSGVGAGGYIIDPTTGRPVQRRSRRQRGSTYGSPTAPVGGRPAPFNPTIDLNVYIDGKQVEATVTRRQQKRRSHNPSQRRGPNAGMASA